MMIQMHAMIVLMAITLTNSNDAFLAQETALNAQQKVVMIAIPNFMYFLMVHVVHAQMYAMNVQDLLKMTVLNVILAFTLKEALKNV